MNYFTPELISRGRSDDDAVLDQVEVEWDEAGDRYRSYYQSIESQVPAGLRRMQSDYYLHDAEVLSIGRQGNAFVIVLRLDTPPRNLLIFTYDLVGEPVIDRESLSPKARSQGCAEWLYDELELTETNPVCCRHFILLSNGWEMQLPVRDVVVSQMQPLLPISHPPSAVTTLTN